jgi:hypothetical protein
MTTKWQRAVVIFLGTFALAVLVNGGAKGLPWILVLSALPVSLGLGLAALVKRIETEPDVVDELHQHVHSRANAITKNLALLALLLAGLGLRLLEPAQVKLGISVAFAGILTFDVVYRRLLMKHLMAGH